MGADRNQWQFPRNVPDKVLGWRSDGKGMENKTVPLLGLTLASEIRDFLDTPPYVADRTALKALDTTKDTVALLSETGREGVFKWEAGDYSSQVTSDPEEGLYVKADAIASTAGAWVRQGGWAITGVQAEWFGAVGDGNRLTGTGTVNDTALQAAMNLPYNILLGYGIYRVTHPLINRVEERLIIGQGSGYIWGEDSRANFSAPTIILATGTAAKRVMTRRKNRYSGVDPNDSAMSAVMDNEASGARFQNFAIELYCDYTDATPTNYGHDWDIGFFNGCRGHVVVSSVLVVGYFRKASFYIDVTRGDGIPELLDYDLEPLPIGSNDRSGSDDILMEDVFCVGGRVGRAILGVATGRTGASYYDGVTTTTYTDTRGLSGCSDFRSERGTIGTVNHHSGYRVADPTGFGAALTRSNMEAEDDFAPAAQFIDGYAGNSGSTTHGLGAIRGMVFNDNRYMSIEMFRCRHKQCDEIYYPSRTWIEVGFEGTVRTTAGAVITVSDYVNNTYGHLAEDQTYAGSIYSAGVTGGLSQTWMIDGKWSGSDAFGKILARGASISRDTSTLLSQDKALIDVRDTNGSPSERSGVSIAALKPKIRFEDTSGSAIDFDILADAGNFQLRYGSAATDTALANAAFNVSGSTGALYPAVDNARSLGLAGSRWATTYSVQVLVGAGATIITSQSGTPEGSLTAPVGSICTDTTGGKLYVKATGTGNTGWVVAGTQT